MKILWYVNIIMPAASEILGFKSSSGGGWLIGQASFLAKENVDLHIMTVSSKVSEKTTVSADGITYIILPVCEDAENQFMAVIDDVKPALVHIFGTEYEYNTRLITLCAQQNIKHVASLQGVMFDYAKHYNDGLPKDKFNKVNPVLRFMKKVFMADSIALGQQQFESQGEKELSALRVCKNVIGRTHWDNAMAFSANPDTRYFHVNENLRDDFYNDEKWSWETCEKHRILISQGFYPIKGFHQFLPALAEIKKLYPDVQVYVGGQSPFTTHNKFLDYFVDFFFEYQKYIKQLIKKYDVADCIHYTGFLNAAQMKKQFLTANVFVSPSTIENSPNSVGEAMITGTPVVSSNVGGTATMLTHGTDGILYDFYDTDALINGIKTVFDNREKAEYFSANAISHANRTHNRNLNTTAMLEVYKTIMEE